MKKIPDKFLPGFISGWIGATLFCTALVLLLWGCSRNLVRVKTTSCTYLGKGRYHYTSDSIDIFIRIRGLGKGKCRDTVLVDPSKVKSYGGTQTFLQPTTGATIGTVDSLKDFRSILRRFAGTGIGIVDSLKFKTCRHLVFQTTLIWCPDNPEKCNRKTCWSCGYSWY